MGPTYPIFELDLTLVLSYLYIKFGVNRIEIATCRVITQIMFFIHVHILVCQYVKCNCSLWEVF